MRLFVVRMPLVDDLITFEQQGLFMLLGKTVKGFVHCVVADSLGAHSIVGLRGNFFT